MRDSFESTENTLAVICTCDFAREVYSNVISLWNEVSDNVQKTPIRQCLKNFMSGDGTQVFDDADADII
jgi:RNAse (barnase) inhibitor barstar